MFELESMIRARLLCGLTLVLSNRTLISFSEFGKNYDAGKGMKSAREGYIEGTSISVAWTSENVQLRASEYYVGPCIE